MPDLTLEIREQANKTPIFHGPEGTAVGMVTPPIDEHYWAYRVKLAGNQAVVGFPKYTTIGIGFAREEDWNTNLPYTCRPEVITDHIMHNAADPAITREQVIEAIKLIQTQAHADRGTDPERVLEVPDHDA